ncbi:hypothetical protein QX776_05340 [Alteromonadaceae bacterium BrNp21-10]|nr:hypothetical protein [Alteromonadaceae bacterium BrNp21-10]
MQRLIWSLIIITLVHSFFTCAATAGHVEDPHHAYDYAHDQTHDIEADNELDPNHEHQFHAHVSCLIGYDAHIIHAQKPTTAIPTALCFFQSKDNQPPVPPPNITLHA